MYKLCVQLKYMYMCMYSDSCPSFSLSIPLHYFLFHLCLSLPFSLSLSHYLHPFPSLSFSNLLPCILCIFLSASISLQCDQLDEELTSLLQRRRLVMNAALDALSQYRTITAQFPNEYLKQSRSYLWEQCLQDIVTMEGTPEHERLL